MSDGVCCICGYPKSFKSGSYRSACVVCAVKIYFATTEPDSPEHLARKQKTFADYDGDGFDYNSCWDPKVKIAEEQFKKLQDRTQYKVGDRLQVRIKNGEAIWATVLEYRDAAQDILLYLDKDFESGIYKSWTTVDNIRIKTAQKLGIDSNKPNCFWWGDFSDAYYAGSKDISVINYERSEDKVKAPTKMHYEYNPGDRIRIKVQGGSPVWATFIEKGSESTNSLIYLDLPGADSWTTGRENRIDNLKKLGLDGKQRKCLFWGDRDNTISKRYSNNDIEVIEHQPNQKIASEYWFDCETEVQDGKKMTSMCKDHKRHNASQMKVYAAVRKDKSTEIVHICPDQHNHQEEYKWTVVFDKLIPIAVGASTSYKNGDRVQVKIDDTITWATVVDDRGHRKDKREPMLHLDHPHGGAHTGIEDDNLENIKNMGFDKTKRNFWWLEPSDKVLYHQTAQELPKEKSHTFKVGDAVKYNDETCGNAIKGHSFKIKKIVKSGEDPNYYHIYLEGISENDFWYAHRFKSLPYNIGDRLELEYMGNPSWGTVVGYETASNGKENPIVYLDTPAKGFGGSVDVFYRSQSDLQKNLFQLGLDKSATNRFWLVNGNDKIISHYSPPSGDIMGTFNIKAITAETIPLISDTVISVDNVQNTAAKDLWIDVNHASNFNVATTSNTISWDAWDKIKGEFLASFIVDPEKVNYEGKAWFGQYGNEPPKNVIPREEPEKSFGSMVKEDATSAGYRVVASQLTKGIKSALLKIMEDRGADNNKIALVQEFLDTEMGSAIIGMLLGYSLTYVPKISEDPRAQRLAGEFRVGGMTVAGNTLMDIVWQYVRNLPSPEKVRVNENEVRIAEEIEEEVEENEKSSGSSNN